MNRSYVKEMLPIFTAFANGEIIEVNVNGSWQAIDSSNFSLNPERYRIRPKPRTFYIVVSDADFIISAHNRKANAEGVARKFPDRKIIKVQEAF